ncbi:hypothetical protein NN3_19550 [Nocardia neocaledoniensis NBRC 108232]|uniref:SnoaL-like protein n=1 Tax=Nocardia neocaledoniensis TaxID=236511 RepID=A0A317NI49_9NOCA|nr:nuclear transport factor 2 family protein [Nocardia neocaledoniensis]PWV74991.1 SnoaL-like protein [Nocardia neocaledoniensis]GEM30948.1 hypothetical protein NN3_19550 [Nocardia neocaledoniensis NBRC 108232]
MSEVLELVEQVKLLTERLETLETVRALNALRDDLPRRINEGRWAEDGELFSADAHLDYRHLGQARGRDAIAAYFAGLPLPKAPSRQASSPTSTSGRTAGGASRGWQQYAR